MVGIDGNQRYKSKGEGMEELKTKEKGKQGREGMIGNQRIRKEGKMYERKEKDRERKGREEKQEERRE